MTTHMVNVSAFDTATYMIRIKNLFLPGILCLFFTVCSRVELDVFSE